VRDPAADHFDGHEAERQGEGPCNAAIVVRAVMLVPRARVWVVVTVGVRAHERENTERGRPVTTGQATAFGILGEEPRLNPAVTHPDITVVVPVCNEEENVAPLAREIAAALRGRAHFEAIFVDDGSTDATAEVLKAERAASMSELRVLRHSIRRGQSAALWTGVRAARAPWIATLDGDGQNDPADIAALIAARDDPANRGVLIFMGNRVSRRDTWLRRLSSRIANAVRRGLLDDGTPDTGCGIKLLHRDTYLSLPLFDHMHRFLPALFQRAGSRVVSVPVNHRPRTRGQSKYGLWNRLWVGIVDIFGVMWLKRRFRSGLQVTED
jgi:dolichol-phosphate mannosyltransferase